ncbi:hypothetical protein DVH24_038722 [Malus domestica]|uniref:Uncharacterized protein n=1 Tax=Malus domestica TaxID=3750 RepID=A0A498KAE3_MALDO|nr:hypothetical protein DVH24_038722 [Malus domestica]
MAETTPLPGAPQPSKLWKGVFAVAGIMTTLVTYGVLQEKIMRVPYGDDKAFFKYSLFLVFCNRITTSAVSAGVLWARKKALDPVAPVYKYGLVSISNILTTTCQYEALKYVSFPVQTLAKCAKMIPVMYLFHEVGLPVHTGTTLFSGISSDSGLFNIHSISGMVLGSDSLKFIRSMDGAKSGVLVRASRPILLPDIIERSSSETRARNTFLDDEEIPYVHESDSEILTDSDEQNAGSADIGPSDIYGRGRENTIWGISLMIGYLGFDGFTSTFQDKLFKGYDMEIHNQIFYTTFCSCVLSMTGLLLQGQLLPAIHFVASHNGCFFDIALLSTVATASQFFISYTIRTFGALTFATIMTTRQLASIMLSCLWFSHPLSWEQWMGAVSLNLNLAIVFGSLYAKSFLRTNPSPSQQIQNGASSPVKAIP